MAESKAGAPSAIKGNKWVNLVAVTMAFMFTFLSRFIWTSVSGEVSVEFGIGVTQVSLYMSAFFAGYLITQLPGGVLADALQPKFIIIICTLLGACTTGLMSTVHSYEFGLVLRVLTGVASGCVMASCSKVVAIHFPGPQRANGMGVLLSAPSIGIIVANQVGPRLNATIGWRNTFVVTAVIGVAIAVAVLLMVNMLPKMANDPSRPKTGVLEGLKKYFSDPQQLITGLSGFMFMFVNVGFATWAMVYVKSMGYTPMQGGAIITAYSIAGVVGTCFSGAIANKLKMNHKQFLILSLSGICVGTVGFSLVQGYTMLILLGVVYGFFSYLPSTHYTTLAQRSAGDQYAASATASQNLIFQSSGLVQPAIVGIALEATGNQSIMWYIFAACAAMAVVFCLFIKSPAKAKN